MHFAMPFFEKWDSKPVNIDSVAAVYVVEGIFSNLVIMLFWTVWIQVAV